jgi:MFS family permease
MRLAETFSALRHHNYRLWFVGQLTSLVGTWMQNTAQGYLIFELTRSESYLGFISFIAGIPSWLFMLVGGVIADRMARRTMLIITQSAMMLLAFILAGLVFTNLVQPWMIAILAFILGIANAFDGPPRQSFVLELVNREDMTNAIALNATMFNMSMIIGPAIAGMTYAAWGAGWCFILNGISFIAVIVALLFMRIKPQTVPLKRVSTMESLKDGFRYVRSDGLTLMLILSVFFINVFGFGLLPLIPAWAVDVLGGDVRTNGYLLSARGVGAVIGALTIAALASRGIRGRLWTLSSFLIPLGLVAFALLPTLKASLILLGVVGFALINLMNNSNAMIQSRVPDELRGRVMAIFTLSMMGGMPIGSALLGPLAEQIGIARAVLAGSIILLVYAAWVFWKHPEVRRMG